MNETRSLQPLQNLLRLMYLQLSSPLVFLDLQFIFYFLFVCMLSGW